MPIFSGDESVELWKAINKISKKKKRKKIAKAVEKAIYLLGCKCQEFETELIRRQEKLNDWYKENIEGQ